MLDGHPNCAEKALTIRRRIVKLNVQVEDPEFILRVEIGSH